MLAFDSKTNHHDSKEDSNDKSSHASKSKTPPSALRSPPRKHQTGFASSKRSIKSTSQRASSSRKPYPSHTTSISGFTTDLDTAVNTGTSYQFAHTEIDLREVSAWAYAHPNQSLHPYGISTFAYHSYDIANTSTCPYHKISMEIAYNSNWSVSESGEAFTPLQRWLEEDAGDGGALALQLGVQPRVDCTCIVMQDGMF
jgi:hypothetical protein